jgi:hypothetical protein
MGGLGRVEQTQRKNLSGSRSMTATTRSCWRWSADSAARIQVMTAPGLVIAGRRAGSGAAGEGGRPRGRIGPARHRFPPFSLLGGRRSPYQPGKYELLSR